jgi:membrane protein required for colicin V production
MNLIDVLFILLLVGILALGFFQGTIRLAVIIIAFYLSVVLASLYYPAVGSFLFNNFGGERYASEYIGFFLVMLIAGILLITAGLYTFRYVQVPERLQIIDHIVGTLLGLFLAALMLGVLASLLWQLMVISGGGNIEMPLFQMLGRGVRNSFLLSYFADFILPETYNYVRPILPGGAQLIFEV